VDLEFILTSSMKSVPSYKKGVELSYEAMRVLYERHRKSPSRHTGVQKVLQYMYDNNDKIWFWSYELNGKVNSNGDFLSHRACARASDLAIHYPELVESRAIGRIHVYRVRLENEADIIKFLNTYEK